MDGIDWFMVVIKRERERKYQRERKREMLWPPILPIIADDEFMAWCPSQLPIKCVFFDFAVLK